MPQENSEQVPIPNLFKASEPKPFPKSAKILLVAGMIVTILLVYVDIIYAHDSSLLVHRANMIQSEGCIVNSSGMSLLQDGIFQKSLNLNTWNRIGEMVNQTLPCNPTPNLFGYPQGP